MMQESSRPDIEALDGEPVELDLTPEPLTLLVDYHQFQHYYSPELEKNPQLRVQFDVKYSMRSCMTTGIEQNTSKRCTCGKYLLIRGTPPGLSQKEKELEKKLGAEE